MIWFLFGFVILSLVEAMFLMDLLIPHLKIRSVTIYSAYNIYVGFVVTLVVIQFYLLSLFRRK